MKFNKIMMAAVAVCGLSFVSCSDDDTVKTPLPSTQGQVSATTYNTVSVTWNRVEGALQYCAQILTGDEVAVQTIVTRDVSAQFTDLAPATAYIVKVVAYANVNSDKTTSEPYIINVDTAPLTLLPTPQPVVDMSSYNYIVSWDWDKNADEYSYELTLGGEVVESGYAEESSISFSGLADGEYTFTVKGETTVSGYADSKPGSVTFTVGLHELYRVTGTYKSLILNESWEATLVAYSDYTYELLGWYGVEGYNLDFAIDPSNTGNKFSILNDVAVDSATGAYKVPTGLKTPSGVYVLPTNNRCKISGNAAKGTLTLYVYGTKWVNDKFTWSN